MCQCKASSGGIPPAVLAGYLIQAAEIKYEELRRIADERIRKIWQDDAEMLLAAGEYIKDAEKIVSHESIRDAVRQSVA